MKQHIEALNKFIDDYKSIAYIVGLLGILGFGVFTPNMRLSKLEEQRKKDYLMIVANVAYLRVLATASCLERTEPVHVAKSQRSKNGQMMSLLCDRVLSDKTNLAMPADPVLLLDP